MEDELRQLRAERDDARAQLARSEAERLAERLRQDVLEQVRDETAGQAASLRRAVAILRRELQASEQRQVKLEARLDALERLVDDRHETTQGTIRDHHASTEAALREARDMARGAGGASGAQTAPAPQQSGEASSTAPAPTAAKPGWAFLAWLSRFF